MSITPMEVERKLIALSKEIDEAHQDLTTAEHKYHTVKAGLEIAMAKSRMQNSHPDMKMTSVQREDMALIANSTLHMELAIAEAEVKASRANANRIRTQVDIARSISVSVRASLEII
jgi:hypothetical protein